LLAEQHSSPRGDCRRLEDWPARIGIGGSRTTSSPSTPSVGRGRSRAAYASGAVLESRSRQPTFPRDPRLANTRDAEISSRTGGSAKGTGVQALRRERGRCAPGLDSPWLLRGCGTLRGALTTSATAAIPMSDSGLDALALPPDVLTQKHSPQLGKGCRRCVVEHGEDCDPVGKW
jgi:hypothetical protein